MKKRDLKPIRAIVRKRYPIATIEYDTDEQVFIAVKAPLVPKLPRDASYMETWKDEREAGMEIHRAGNRREAWEGFAELVSGKGHY